MKEQIVSFETAKLAKEKGFNEAVREVYDIYSGTLEEEKRLNKFNGEDFLVSAPTQSLLHKWLREEHNIWINIIPEPYSHGSEICMSILYVGMEKRVLPSGDTMEDSTFVRYCKKKYEEALEDGLRTALKLIEEH